MNVAECRLALRREGVRDDAYSLLGISGDERYCLVHGSDGWSVFYHERGMRQNEQLFSDEDAACQYLLALVTSDPTTR